MVRDRRRRDRVFRRYAAADPVQRGRGRAGVPPRVWCSWYSLYTAIDERILHRVLDQVAGMPFEVFQVDDGWQAAIGDWEPNGKFPSGMEALAAHIRGAGFVPGLWLAPLLAVPSSRLHREHPEWLLRDARGRLVSAGFNWGEPLHALDCARPEVLAWLAALMQKVRAWGFGYAKLDFLYAGALPGMRGSGMPREAAYRNALRVMREALGDAYLLACGAPVFPSVGLCDAMRIGPDVEAWWDLPRDSRLLANYAAPGTPKRGADHGAPAVARPPLPRRPRRHVLPHASVRDGCGGEGAPPRPGAGLRLQGDLRHPLVARARRAIGPARLSRGETAG